MEKLSRVEQIALEKLLKYLRDYGHNSINSAVKIMSEKYGVSEERLKDIYYKYRNDAKLEHNTSNKGIKYKWYIFRIYNDCEEKYEVVKAKDIGCAAINISKRKGDNRFDITREEFECEKEAYDYLEKIKK